MKLLKSKNKTTLILFMISLIALGISLFVLANSSWKLRLKGSTREILTNPIIKGTSVFIDIYDLSNLFNIDYEVNLTRKYILFHKPPTLPSQSDQQNKPETKQNSPEITTHPPEISKQHNINKILYNKLMSIKTIVISNPIDSVEKIDKDTHKTYTEDFENLEKVIKDSFSEKSFKTIVLDNNFRLNKINLDYIKKYLSENKIDACIIPVVKKYYYYEKDGNTLIPTVELQINYMIVNNQGEVVFFSVQNITRNIAILSSSSTRYRKSKLLDLAKMSVEGFIRDYTEYTQILQNN
ncbi:MAG: hypothetical protein RMJ51_01610 [Candidatus Calescibacterium sp.]|nr:hypothetical protein [Candidatus Calescibacterium sp.]MCX7971812.1 hypothetical protein [bacterium]MDW8194926.1 hypothetical protein [Candidatus Calescibacterium sp.]